MSNILVYNNTITHLSKIAKGFKFKHVLFPHFWCCSSSCFCAVFFFRYICMLEKRKKLSVSIVTKTYWYLLRLLNNKPLDHSVFIKPDEYYNEKSLFHIFFFFIINMENRMKRKDSQSIFDLMLVTLSAMKSLSLNFQVNFLPDWERLCVKIRSQNSIVADCEWQ